jgi:transposase
MTEHDVLVGFRLRLFTLAEELGNVSAACRAMGVHRSTYYRLKRKVDRWGLEALNVRERRRPRMPNEIGPHLEQRIVAFALAHPGLGPRRISAELAREKWGGIRVWEHGVWRVLCRVGLNTRSKRLALVAGHRDRYERRPPLPEPERHIDASEPGENRDAQRRFSWKIPSTFPAGSRKVAIASPSPCGAIGETISPPALSIFPSVASTSSTITHTSTPGSRAGLRPSTHVPLTFPPASSNARSPLAFVLIPQPKTVS